MSGFGVISKAVGISPFFLVIICLFPYNYTFSGKRATTN
jgi:hypothetical protein